MNEAPLIVPQRKIIHVDMDAFFAAVEQRDDPELRGIPLAVGGESGRGVVMTASYEARRFGVRSAMPSAHARRLCPTLRFVRPRFDAYKEASAAVRTIFRRYTHAIEPLSLDEAYLDVSAPLDGSTSAVRIARAIKDEIAQTTGLTASAGVSFNKFLAKIASDLDKPDGLAVIRPEQAWDFLASLPIERFHGVGPATARRLRAAGIACGGDLQRLDHAALVRTLGKRGLHYWRMARAEDDRAVQVTRNRRSLSIEDTFKDDLTGYEQLERELATLAMTLSQRLASARFLGRTLTLKIKYFDFRITTRSRTFELPILESAELREQSGALLRTPELPARAVRLLGLGVSNALEHDRHQLDLFEAQG